MYHTQLHQLRTQDRRTRALLHLNFTPFTPDPLLLCPTLPIGDTEEPLDLYVVGGYLGKSCAEELSSGLFSALHESRRPFRVVLACMARLNSVPTRGSAKSPAGERRDQPPAAAEGELRQRGAVSEDPRHDDAWLPRQTGLAVDIATGRAYPVRFEGAGRGPGWEARSSRVFAGSRETALTEVGGGAEGGSCRSCFLNGEEYVAGRVPDSEP